MTGLLQTGAFRWMWAGQTVSMLGDAVHDVAMAWLVLTLTGSPLTLGLVLVTGAVPRTVGMIFGGALTDRLSARTLLLLSNLVRCGLALLLATLVLGRYLQLWEIYVLELAFGAADGFFLPAVNAVVPDLVEDADLVRANAMMGTSEQVSMLAGPAVGGVIVALAGSGGAFLANALSFVVAAAGILPSGVQKAPVPQSEPVWASIGQGITLVRADPELRAVFALAVAAATAGGAVFLVGLPTLAITRLGLGATGLGLVLSSWGVGQLAGALSAARTGLPRRWGYLIIASVLGDAVVYALVGSLHSVLGVMALLVPLGCLTAYSSDVARPVWIQRHATPAMLGRVFSLLALPYYAVAPLAMVAMGAIAARNLTLGFDAAASMMWVTAVLALANRTVRGLTI